MAAIARVIPVVPVSLVARAFVPDPGRSWSELELKARALEDMRALEARGAHVYVPRGDQDYAIDVGLRMLTLRRLVDEEDGLFTPRLRGAAAARVLREQHRAPVRELIVAGLAVQPTLRRRLAQQTSRRG